MLPHLPDAFTAVVTGTGGGIGHAMVQSLLASPQVGKLIAVSRSGSQTNTDPRVQCLQADITQESGRQLLVEQLNGEPVHLLFNAIGILHDSQKKVAPEKRLEELDTEAFDRVMHINAATPALLIADLKGSLQGKHPTIIASLSARVGSIGDNGFGGWYSYRASKAAHNMLLKTASIELKRLNKQSIILCLHPGTTDTELSKPFQARVPENKLFTPDFVAQSLIDVMAQRAPEDTGSFWDWAGKPIEW
ncbi:SDR family NAD(P)-dependent oxidoreductase [Halomonas llamarensis]|uniref:SDR family NAD(P)-dependent oxidoreductase n=1 Tax=Halomonas llamarensis TaxID=2945104 RepID=A0ABT0SND6_9GAMM|nr:SDR family NAD(P)-dependent oxidoreductase [Halomonas llamarensis]MCL7929307.1 SDR family NAD(P)-dependent oxidoreductase [Halomonas llamarensis]